MGLGISVVSGVARGAGRHYPWLLAPLTAPTNSGPQRYGPYIPPGETDPRRASRSKQGTPTPLKGHSQKRMTHAFVYGAELKGCPPQLPFGGPRL